MSSRTSSRRRTDRLGKATFEVDGDVLSFRDLKGRDAQNVTLNVPLTVRVPVEPVPGVGIIVSAKEPEAACGDTLLSVMEPLPPATLTNYPPAATPFTTRTYCTMWTGRHSAIERGAVNGGGGCTFRGAERGQRWNSVSNEKRDDAGGTLTASRHGLAGQGRMPRVLCSAP